MVGDIDVAGNFSDKAKGGAKPEFMPFKKDDGRKGFRKSPKALLAIHKKFAESGRVYTARVAHTET